MSLSLSIAKEERSKNVAKPAPFLFCTIVIVVYLAFLTFFEQGFPAMDPVYTQPFSDSEFFLTFALVMILGILVLLLGYRHFKIGINWVIATICLLLFISDVIAIMSFPSSYPVSNTYTYHLTSINRVRYIFSWFASCMGLYMIFAVIPKMAINSRQWDFLFGLGVFAALFAIIYSYFVEADLYASFFNPDAVIDVYKSPLSFTNNRNTYGTILLIGVISSAYLHVRNHKWWYFLLSLFIYLNEFLVLSKTVIIASTFFYLCFLVWLYAITIRHHAIRANLVLFLFICSFLGVIIIHNTEAIPSLASFQKFINSVLDLFADKGVDSIESRIDLWNIQFANIYSDPMYIVFGFGDHNYEPLLGALFNESTELGYAHMGILDVFGRLGIVGVLAYVVTMVYAIILIVRGIGNKRKITFVCMFTLIAFLIHGSMESTNFLGLAPTSLVFLLGVFLPLLTDDANDRRPEVIDYYARLYTGQAYPKEKRGWTPLDIYQLSLFIITPIAAILIGIGPIVTQVMGSCSFDNWNAKLALILLLVLLPIALAGSFSSAQARKPFGWTLLALSIIVSVLFFILCFFIDGPIIPIGLSLCLCIIIVLSAVWRKKKKVKNTLKYFLSFFVSLTVAATIWLFYVYVANVVKPSNDTRYVLPIVILICVFFYVLIAFIAMPYVDAYRQHQDSLWFLEKRLFMAVYSSFTKKETRNLLFYKLTVTRKRN